MLVGLAVILLASVFLGTFALPGKYIKNYPWENTWGSFFFFAMLVIPVGFGFLALNGLVETYVKVGPGIVAGVMALGFLWGCGFCLWGIGLERLGLSLGYALTMGTMALCGSMLPFFLGNAEKAATPGGMVIITGILICIAGVSLNGVAGVKRDQAKARTSLSPKKGRFTNVLIGVMAGLLSSCINIAFHIGSTLGKIDSISVTEHGNPAWLGGLSIWVLIFTGGLLSSFGYAAYKLTVNKTWGNFLQSGSGRNLSLAFLMGLLHFGCLFFYGLGGWKLGALGTSVGFAIFQTGALLVGNCLGFMSGEWKTASAESRTWLYSGLAVLIAGIIVVAAGNAM